MGEMLQQRVQPDAALLLGGVAGGAFAGVGKELTVGLHRKDQAVAVRHCPNSHARRSSVDHPTTFALSHVAG